MNPTDYWQCEGVTDRLTLYVIPGIYSFMFQYNVFIQVYILQTYHDVLPPDKNYPRGPGPQKV